LKCPRVGKGSGDYAEAALDTSAKAAALRKLQAFNTQRVKELFATRKLAISTSLLIVIWGSHYPFLPFRPRTEAEAQRSLDWLFLCITLLLLSSWHLGALILATGARTSPTEM